LQQYELFLNSLRSPETKRAYTIFFKKYQIDSDDCHTILFKFIIQISNQSSCVENGSNTKPSSELVKFDNPTYAEVDKAGCITHHVFSILIIRVTLSQSLPLMVTMGSYTSFENISSVACSIFQLSDSDLRMILHSTPINPESGIEILTITKMRDTQHIKRIISFSLCSR